MNRKPNLGEWVTCEGYATMRVIGYNEQTGEAVVMNHGIRQEFPIDRIDPCEACSEATPCLVQLPIGGCRQWWEQQRKQLWTPGLVLPDA
jgi:hypothetical protein